MSLRTEKIYPLAFIPMIAFACNGMIAAVLIPSDQVKPATAIEAEETAERARTCLQVQIENYPILTPMGNRFFTILDL